MKGIQPRLDPLQARDPASLLSAAPWLDVYYRRAADALIRWSWRSMRTVVITGANAGLGFQTASKLAHAGAHR